MHPYIYNPCTTFCKDLRYVLEEIILIEWVSDFNIEGINDVGRFLICVSILNRLFQLLLIVIPDCIRSV